MIRELTERAARDALSAGLSEIHHDFRTNKSDIAFVQRAMASRNGRMAMRYATSTISNSPNIARMAVKFGESSATNKAGTYVTIAKIFSPIQSSISFLLGRD